MAMPTKQASDKNVFQWRESPFVYPESGLETDAVGEANNGTGDSQRLKRPYFQTTDKGD